MPNYLTTDTELTAIANSIRIKGGTSAALTYPTDFITAIEAIETTPETQTKTVNPSESSQTVEPDSGKLLSAVTVTAVSSNYVGSNIPRKSSSDLTATGSVVTAPSGYYAAAASTVIAEGAISVDSKNITTLVVGNITLNSSTGLISITRGAFNSVVSGKVDTSGYVVAGTTATNSLTISKATASYQLDTQSAATITPVESSQVAVAAGKYTTGAVTVAAISSDYIGSNIAQNSAADVVAAGPTVSIPSGYYSADVSKTIASGTLNEYVSMPSIDPAWTLNSSTGIISVSSAVAPGIEPIATSGYFNTGEYIYPLITMDSSYQLSTQSAATYTPSTATQTIPSGVYLTGVQTIEPIPIAVDNHRLIVPEGYIGV